MGEIEKEFHHNVMSEYFVQQHQIATELMLGLTDENNRKIASKWLHYLYDVETGSRETSAKLLIIQGLILMMNVNTLVPPLNEPPTADTDVAKLSECHFIHLINQELNKLRPSLPPTVKYEVTEDRKEYVAYQKIPGYGSHFCYVFSNDAIVSTEDESGTPVLDESVRLEKQAHPLIQKYAKEIRTCLPPKRTPMKFQYHDLTESFGGMNMPEIDPDDDVEQEYELVKTDGEIGAHDSRVMSDFDESEDRYDKFSQDPAHHDRPRVGLKDTVLEKEAEQRALLEDRLKNRMIVRPEAPKLKRTVATRVRTVKLQPVSLGGNKIGFMGHIPKQSMLNSSNDSSCTPNNRRNLIQAMNDLEQEMRNSQETDMNDNSVQIPSNIQQAIDRVWQNPLMQNLQPLDRHVSLPPPPKINFDDDSLDKHQSH